HIFYQGRGAKRSEDRTCIAGRAMERTYTRRGAFFCKASSPWHAIERQLRNCLRLRPAWCPLRCHGGTGFRHGVTLRHYQESGASPGTCTRSAYRTYLSRTRACTAKGYFSPEPQDQHGENVVPCLAALPEGALRSTSSLRQGNETPLRARTASRRPASISCRLVQSAHRAGVRQGGSSASKTHPGCVIPTGRNETIRKRSRDAAL